MNYRRIDFSDTHCFSEFVQEIYCLKHSGKHEGQETCAVNGNIGLSFSLRGSTRIEENDTWIQAPRVFTFGMADKPHYFRTTPDYKELTISFRAHQLRHFVRESMSHLGKGKIVDAYDLFPRQHLDQLYESLCRTDDTHQIGLLVDEFLRASFQPRRNSKRLQLAHQTIWKGDADSVKGLASRLNVTTATLRNDFRDNIGLAPKTLIRISRINRVLQHRPTEQFNFTDLALQMGYFDQAHFVNEFRHVIGVSPKKYFQNKELIFDFYNYGRWINNTLHR